MSLSIQHDCLSTICASGSASSSVMSFCYGIASGGRNDAVDLTAALVKEPPFSGGYYSSHEIYDESCTIRDCYGAADGQGSYLNVWAN
jgi:hypothetical protein